MEEISKQNKPHNVCSGGCEGVSDKAGTCQAEGCPSHEKPLNECSCEDEKHISKLEKESK